MMGTQGFLSTAQSCIPCRVSTTVDRLCDYTDLVLLVNRVLPELRLRLPLSLSLSVKKNKSGKKKRKKEKGKMSRNEIPLSAP